MYLQMRYIVSLIIQTGSCTESTETEYAFTMEKRSMAIHCDYLNIDRIMRSIRHIHKDSMFKFILWMLIDYIDNDEINSNNVL